MCMAMTFQFLYFIIAMLRSEHLNDAISNVIFHLDLKITMIFFLQKNATFGT